MPDVQEPLSDYPLTDVPPLAMWSENYAFMISDPAAGVAVASQLGRWPVAPELWREFFMIALPGERIAYHRAFGKAATAQTVCASLFRIDVIEEHRRFRLRFAGPLVVDSREGLLSRGVTALPAVPSSFDLEFEGVAPVWNMSGHAATAEALAGKMHVEQVGKVGGAITIGEEQYRLGEAFGQRDHSRGQRIITRLHRHCWAQGWFPDADVTFNVYVMTLHGEAAPMTNASVTRAGVRYPATIVSVALMESEDDHAKPYAITIDSALGPMTFALTAFTASMPTAFCSPYDKFPGTMPHARAASSNEEAVIWSWNGHSGIGWSERSFNREPFPQ